MEPARRVEGRGNGLEMFLTNTGALAILSARLDRRPGSLALGELDLRALRSPYQIPGGQQCPPDFFLEVHHGATASRLH